MSAVQHSAQFIRCFFDRVFAIQKINRIYTQANGIISDWAYDSLGVKYSQAVEVNVNRKT